MADAADKAAEDQERAHALFDEEQRRARIAESMRGYDPSVPVDCMDCGVIVPQARLEAYPRTRRCQPCASKVERDYRARWPS